MNWDLTTIEALRRLGAARIKGPDFELEFYAPQAEMPAPIPGQMDADRVRESLMSSMKEDRALEDWSV